MSTWTPFGTTEDDWKAAPVNGTPHGREQRIVNVKFGPGKKPGDRAGRWLTGAMLALGVLAAAAAVVSFDAQYRMVYAAKHVAAIAALEAGVPDVSAVVFAALGIALALHGRRAVRARLLNAGAIATSIGMNALAAGTGWRDMAIWVMPPVAYALASDTCIGVIRSVTITRQHGGGLDGETTLLGVVARAALWVLRFGLDRKGTWGALRGYVIGACPVPAPEPDEPAVPAITAAKLPAPLVFPPEPAPAPAKPPARRPKDGKSKTAQFLDLVKAEHGDLADIDLGDVYAISNELAPRVSLHPGSARAALRARIQDSQR